MADQGPQNDVERIAVERFQTEVCLKSSQIDPEEEFDWTSLSIGFFLACGVTDMERVEALAAWARYRMQYWI